MQQAKHIAQQEFEIREVRVADARPLNRFIRQSYATSRHLITRTGEYKMGAFRQRLWISKKLSNSHETCLVALSDGQIIGMIDSWTDRRKRVAHATCFAMSVALTHQGQGVGKALLTRFINWVKAHKSVERVELHVHSDNIPAIGLYKSCGFELEGVRKSAVFYEDGRKVDDYIMALWP